jgi:two-component system sensor histidine kinase EvgS
LNGIVGTAELLTSCKGLPRESTELIETIQSSSVQLSIIIFYILDYSKLESGILTLRTASIPLNTLLERAVALGRLQKLTEITIDYSIDPNVPPALQIDGIKLTQIFVNLISNTFKFTVHGSVTVLSVSDTGIGIAQDKFICYFKVSVN